MAALFTLRVADPDGRHAAVRLCSDLPLGADEREFAREEKGWVLRIPQALIDRLEYQLELVGHDGAREVVRDAANPVEAPGAFGPKSVLVAPRYRPPAWLEGPAVDGALLDAGDARIWSPSDARADARLPLLVAHDGPEYDELASLTRYCAAMIAAERLPPHRVALLPPGDRNERYSASAAYARELDNRVVPALREAVPVAGRPVGMGASLGALAILHAHRRRPHLFAGLFLQSGSFFVPRFDRHESGFGRYQRIVRFVREVLRAPGPHPYAIPVTLTCGAEEENVHNNRLMARALEGQGYEAALHEVADLHNYTSWRDAFDPFLTTLLARLWRS